MADDGAPASGAKMALGVSFTNPSGDLNVSAGVGYGASISWEWALKKKHSLRAGFVYAAFREKTFYDSSWLPPYAPPIEKKGRANTKFGMLDYIYSFISHDSGLYLIVGAGYGDFSVKPDDYGNAPKNDAGICLSAGAGYTATRHFRVEAKTFLSMPDDHSRPMGLFLYPWQQASLIYRF
jgi:hypothetical protein